VSALPFGAIALTPARQIGKPLFENDDDLSKGVVSHVARRLFRIGLSDISTVFCAAGAPSAAM